MKVFVLITFILLLSISSPAFSWGQTGHRITGAIAENYLSDKAQSAISKLLPGESLAEASTYADEMRSNPSEYWQKTASPWHYVTVSKGSRYSQLSAPKAGDAISALKAFKATLQSNKATRAEKQLALRFTIHLIGDLHQPLHAGNGTDRGGNDRKLTFFRSDSNLHRVWDSGMIDRRKLSYSEWADWLNSKVSPSQARQWRNTNPLSWIEESANIRDDIYPATDSLSYNYLYHNLPILKQRLQQAGIRMATYLNEVYAKEAN